MVRRSVIVATAALGMLLVAPSARADTVEILMPQRTPAGASDGWQAGSCTADAPVKCAPDTPGLFFRTAGGHPPISFMHFNVRHAVVEENVEPLIEPVRGRVVKTVKVDLPPGMVVNPTAAPERCPLSAFFHLPDPEPCPPGSKIGQIKVTLVATKGILAGPKGFRIDNSEPRFERLSLVDVFSIEPLFGEPARFGFFLLNQRFSLETEIAFESDYHESFALRNLTDFSVSPVLPIAIHSARLVNFGNVGDGTFATLPTTCFNSDLPDFKRLYSSWIRVDSHENPVGDFPSGVNPFESPPPPGVHPEGCENVPFDPSIEVAPGTATVDSPAAPTVTSRLKVEVPGEGDGLVAQSHLRRTEVTLPAGMGLNPAGLKGLVACGDAALNKGTRELFHECPTASIVGTAEIRTPILSEALQGNLYLGEPKSTDPASGDRFRLFLEAASFERGVVVRLIGKVKADPRTGRLTAVFDEQQVAGAFAGPLPPGLPQVPFESLTLRFDNGANLLTSPPTCSRATTTASMEPWARPGTQKTPSSNFILTAFPGGGACPTTLQERPFAPSSSAKSDNAKGGSFSPFRVRIARPPGHQELKLLDVVLPKGLIGKLAGIPYCSEQAIAAAAAKSGVAERNAPSCPAASMVGTTSTESGSGNDPLKLAGNVYLSGPYKGAPLSLAAFIPAVSGPFDLGTVVVRVALHVDPTSAQVTARSDAVPDVLGGVKLSLRAIDFNLDRNGFMLNPTNCSPQAITGSLRGGGADPAEAAAWSSFALNAPLRATGCEDLGFAPQLTTKLSGPKKRKKYPGLNATLTTRGGDANIARVALALPPAFRVAQNHISTLCTRAQLASHSCPPASVYGNAEASTPLLDGKLSGPVHLVPGGGKLPDLVADLRGQVDIQLRGEIRSPRKGIEVVFDSLPDIPVREFTLAMAGGKKGLIVNSTNVCKSKRRAVLSIRAQNGKQLTNKKYKLKLAGCKQRKKKRKG
jgi:hypothetical protein